MDCVALPQGRRWYGGTEIQDSGAELGPEQAAEETRPLQRFDRGAAVSADSARPPGARPGHRLCECQLSTAGRET